MLTRKELSAYFSNTVLLDGATGSNLQKAGMPRGCCTEEWILANPDKLIALQRQYAAAGSNILYAPTFQAQPIALDRVGLAKQAEAINAHLVALTKSVSPDVLVAGNLTTLAVYCDSFDPENFDLLVENYRVQISMMGRTRISKRRVMVFSKFRCRFSSRRSSAVSRIWATVWL